MKTALFSLLAFFLLIAGCTQPEPHPTEPISDYVLNDSPITQNQSEINSSIQNQSDTQIDSNSQISPPNLTDIQNSTLPQPQETEVPKNNVRETIAQCADLENSQIMDCVSQLAISSKNVSMCTSFWFPADRLSCITRWCLSASRDFTQCERLENIDERLGCLNKCNPNQNN